MPIIGVIASSMKGAPGIPTIGTATDVGTARAYNNGAATITFTPGTGATATSFTATSSPGGFTATGASSPLTVTGLQSSTSYTFTVTATNASGTSAASAASNSITATTVPQAPTIGTATGGNNSATVTYTAGATGGAAVSAYTATSSPGSITGTGASPITVSGLTNGTAYTFTVTATNANGTSLASAASNSVTPVNPYTASWDWIAEATPNGTGTVTFSSLPSGYQEFKVIGKTRSDGDSIGFTQINGNTSNYAEFAYYGAQGGFSSGAGNAVNSTQARRFAVSAPAGESIGSPMMIDYFGANSTVAQKNIQINSTYGQTPSSFQFTYATGIQSTTSAITSIRLATGNGPSASGSWLTPTVFSVYGLKEGPAI